MLVFGKKKFVDDAAEKRILWAQRTLSLSCIVTAGSYVISDYLTTTKLHDAGRQVDEADDVCNWTLYRPDVVALQEQGDATTARRLKYGQYALVPLCFATLLCFILHGVTAFDALQAMAIVFGGTVMICFGFLFYNNISVVMASDC